MSEMFQIIALMAVPAAILVGLRRVVISQNRRLDSQAAPVPVVSTTPFWAPLPNVGALSSRCAARAEATTNYGPDATRA